jgi:hypothetical protein
MDSLFEGSWGKILGQPNNYCEKGDVLEIAEAHLFPTVEVYWGMEDCWRCSNRFGILKFV